MTPFLDAANESDNASFSITGLYEYFTIFQNLYNSFTALKMKYYEENDRMTIKCTASFLYDVEEYISRFEESVAEDDAAAAAYANAPEWILSSVRLSESVRYMRDDARRCCDGSIDSEFHKKLLVCNSYIRCCDVYRRLWERFLATILHLPALIWMY